VEDTPNAIDCTFSITSSPLHVYGHAVALPALAEIDPAYLKTCNSPDLDIASAQIKST